MLSPPRRRAREAQRSAAEVPTPPRPLKELLLPLFLMAGESGCMRADSLGFWRRDEERHWLPRFVFQRTPERKSRIQLGIFAGIHGDEPASILGLIDFVRHLIAHPLLGKDFQVWLYPVCNPAGYLLGTRESPSGRDLNREFWKGSDEPEVALLEQEILRRDFQGIISLHCDDTSEGVYGFARGHVITEELLRPALRAAAAALPTNLGAQIDGFHAIEGIIHSGYGGILSAPPGRHPAPFEIVLETPAHAPLELQRRAFVLGIEAILNRYREFISYGSHL